MSVASKRAEEIQIRRLTRQVEQLEVQLKGARRGAGGGFNRPGASQGKANPQVEREFKKQIKEMEVFYCVFIFMHACKTINTCTFLTFFTLGCRKERKTCIRKATP